MEYRRLKRSVIKEELVAVTGDFISAAILNQLIYWQFRSKDIDEYLEEEKARAARDKVSLDVPTLSGWIYKSAEALADELMLGLSRASVLRKLAPLVEAGILIRRRNPWSKWDKTYQYRVDFVRLSELLHEKGYCLETVTEARITFPRPAEKPAGTGSETAVDDDHNAVQCSTSRPLIAQNETAIPETTTETTDTLFPYPSPGQTPPPADKKPDYADQVRQVTDAILEITGLEYPPHLKGVREPILARLKEGYTVEDCRAVIRDRWKRWKDDPKMKEFIRVSTLFRPTKFPDYLAQARADAEPEEKSRDRLAAAARLFRENEN